MTEPDVTLTDYALFMLCSIFAWKLLKQSKSNELLKSLWIAFFVSVAMASLMGGTVHGFFLDEATLGYRVLWPATLITIGVTAATVWMLAGLLLSGPRKFNLWLAFAGITFVIYSMAVIYHSQSFSLVILNYLPAMFLFLGAALKAYIQYRGRYQLYICLGIFLSLFAAGIQQAHLSIHPVYFNHNSTYHLIQAFGLIVLFFAARKWITLERI